MVEIDNKKWYEDKKYLQNLDIFLDAMKDNDDLVIIFDGKERAGKSKRLRQVAKYCADYLGTTFSQKNIKQDLQQYMDFSIESENYTVCIMDEGRNQLNRKSSMTKIAKKFTNFLSECGKRKQVHIIALPAYHDLDKYLVLWRMKFVIHVHKWYEKDTTKRSGYRLARGKYTMYMNDKYLKDCYNYPYAYPKRWETKGEYSNVEVLTDTDLKLYDHDKDLNIEQRYHSKYEEIELGQREKMWKERAKKLILALIERDTPEMTIADMIGFKKDSWKVWKSREKLMINE